MKNPKNSNTWIRNEPRKRELMVILDHVHPVCLLAKIVYLLISLLSILVEMYSLGEMCFKI